VKVSIGAVLAVAENRRDCVEKDALAVGTRAVCEEQRMLAGAAGEGITDDTLQEALKLPVSGADLVEE
jgi:hypothetical protein